MAESGDGVAESGEGVVDTVAVLLLDGVCEEETSVWLEGRRNSDELWPLSTFFPPALAFAPFPPLLAASSFSFLTLAAVADAAACSIDVAALGRS